ncbi:MAG: ATP-binding cassette domain-containing protein [Bacteroidales bacterium]|jgi:phospholipid/cholesterol/gamma-HCH transport system ATP-binding protein|nr:ATP-binding cassette domain-containing protein [Bacteroidales bacterium]NLM93473.1 ATP-binding cassette domain-containing protein [Bacteroidales bacterium]
MIKVENITKSFEGVPVLKEVTTLFERGKTNLIIGQSGSGKTVLMKCLVGLLESDSGKIMFDNLDFNKMSFADRRIIRKQLGMLFQGGALFDSLTVEENVIFPLNMFSDLSQEEKLDRANFCLQRVNLDNVNHLYPSEISGGMKKRVAIARAIANNPSFLFCDEPNSGLDPRTAIVIDKLISEITQEFNMTTVINTHDMNSVMEIGDKVAFLYKGELWWEGTRFEILDTDNKELNDFVYASELMRTLKK